MEDNLNILKVEYLCNQTQILNLRLYVKTVFYKSKSKMKTTSNGRQPQNINSGISQQPQFGLNSNIKLQLR